MPRLRNPKHEIVAQELAAGKTAVQASVAAGFPSAAPNARRRAQRKEIKARVIEIREKAAAKGVEGVVVTIEKLLHESEQARCKAMRESKGASAAVSAIICKAKLAGLWRERSELSGPAGEPIEVTWREPIYSHSAPAS
jgi:hypothetical protein